jgi:hypothetical protein
MKTIKTVQTLVLAVVFGLAFTSCNNDDDNIPTSDPVQAELVSNLFAPVAGGGQGQPEEGAFIKFDFETGMITESETDWDIAFRGTAIAVNGGVTTGTVGEPERAGNAAAHIATGLFSEISTAEGLTFIQDASEGYAIPKVSDMGWYNYSGPPNFVISPIPGKILVFRTRDGHYAKVEILSYYKDNPSEPNGQTDESRYYTFNYVYNPNTGETSFE